MKRAWLLLRGKRAQRSWGSPTSSESLSGNELQPEGAHPTDKGPSRAGLRIGLALSPQRAALEEQVKELQQQLEKQRQQLEELQQKPRDLSKMGEAVLEILQTLQEMKTEASEHQKEKQRLSEQLSVLREENKALREEELRLLSEKDLYVRKCDEMKLRYQEKIRRAKEIFTQEVRQRDGRIKELENELSLSNLRVEEAKQLITQTTAANEVPLQERGELLQKIADLEGVSRSSHPTTAPLQSRNRFDTGPEGPGEQQDAEGAAGVGQRSPALGRADAVGPESAVSIEAFLRLHDQCLSERERACRALEKNRELSEELSKAQGKNEAREMEVKKLKEELHEAQRKAETWRAQVLQKDQEREEALWKAAEGAQAQLAVLQNENLTLRKQLEDVKSEAAQVQLKTVGQLQKELDDKTRDFKAAESLLTQYQDVISDLNQENTDLQEELCKAMAKVHRLSSARREPEKSSQLEAAEEDLGKGRGLRKKSREPL